MAGAKNYSVERTDIDGNCVVIREYQIGDRFVCHVENCDPGATIARAESDTATEARLIAVAKAAARFGVFG